MAKIPLYNQEGKTVGDIELQDNVFAVSPVAALIHQAYNALLANLREPWAHTKDRSEVRGGGKKPWKQKGTGRARHGSIRSPIWSGGGITFGPLKERSYAQRINKKMKRQAVKMCLSDKVTDQKFIVVDSITTTGKTKELAALRMALPGNGKKTILLVGKKDHSIERAIRNIPYFDIQHAIDVNVVDFLHHQYVIATKDAIDVLQKRLA